MVLYGNSDDIMKDYLSIPQWFSQEPDNGNQNFFPVLFFHFQCYFTFLP